MRFPRDEYAMFYCVDGRRMRHDPQPDDPELMTDRGVCPHCNGKGCNEEDDEAAQ